MTKTDGLTPKQRKAIPLLMTMADIEVIADEIGVTSRTLYRWLELPEFRARLRQAEAASIDRASAILLKGAANALQTILTLMRGSQSESVKLRAARTWLDLLIRFRETRAIEDRLAELEQLAYGKPKT